MNGVIYRGNESSTVNSNRLHSPNVWRDAPISEIRNGLVEGTYFFDDFLNFGTFTEGDDTGAAHPVPYFANGSDGVTMAQLADTDFGVLETAANDADHDGSLLVYGNAAGWARFGPNDRAWFEGRIARASVANDGLAFFLGFVEVNVVPTTVITLVDATAVLDLSEDFVGWRVLQADGDAAEPIYQEGGATLAHVGSGTTNAQGSGNDTAQVAATYYKFGIRWNGKRIEYFVNGLLNSWYTPTSADSFPDTNHLAMCWTTKVGTAAESKAQLDWWAGCAVTTA